MKRVLFVCLGNICRSPSAEAIMKAMISKEGLGDRIAVDSAGTAAYHIGEYPDARSIAHGEKRGYVFDTRARQFDPGRDFEEFDYIVTMDPSNYRNVMEGERVGMSKHKVFELVSFCKEFEVDEVPDPYYGGARGFDRVLDILEDGCSGLLEKIKEDFDAT